VVSPTAVLGRHCTLAQGVTIGHGIKNGKIGSTTIGNRVYIAPGAAVIGPITIGDDALVGINSVVTQSVPPRGVVAGNPGRVISFKGSFDLIYYPGMDQDAARLAALAEAVEKGDRKASDDDVYVVGAAAHFDIDVGAHPVKAAPPVGEVSNGLLPEK
jgi:serine O-acetyltransferase